MFAALGGFTRDIAHLVVVVVPVLVLISPVFYHLDDVPDDVAPYLFINPLTGFIEGLRHLIVIGDIPPMWMIALSWACGLVTFWLGYILFMRYRRVLVDVI